MAGHGAPPEVVLDGTGVQVAVVAASWHQVVMTGLLDGALRACRGAGIEPLVVRVPGSFELSAAASRLARTGRYDAVVALGVVIRGDTPHFDYVCRSATDGLTQVSVEHALPVGFGLLTCDTSEQAIARAGLPGSPQDKGFEAASAAIATAITLATVIAPAD